jgi:predicted membrane chloride channel (bestrophin family)
MPQTQKPRPRTYARNRAFSRKGNEKLFESDGHYFLKLVIYVLISTFWIKFSQPISWMGFTLHAIPVGMILGFILVRQFEKYQSDRKIWYLVLIIVGIISSLMPAGILL